MTFHSLVLTYFLPFLTPPLWPVGASLVAQTGKESSCSAGGPGFPEWERSPGERNGYPFQYSCLENSMDQGAWQVAVHGITESDRTEQLTLLLSLLLLLLLSRFSRVQLCATS